jgi:hypothetical protein
VAIVFLLRPLTYCSICNHMAPTLNLLDGFTWMTDIKRVIGAADVWRQAHWVGKVPTL